MFTVNFFIHFFMADVYPSKVDDEVSETSTVTTTVSDEVVYLKGYFRINDYDCIAPSISLKFEEIDFEEIEHKSYSFT